MECQLRITALQGRRKKVEGRIASNLFDYQGIVF